VAAVHGGASLGESFTPDELNRLQSSTVDGQPGKTFGYDALGDLTSKPGVGTYSYPAPNTGQVHLVSGITGTVAGLANPTFNYDNNGNVKNGVNRQFAWPAPIGD